MSATLPNERQQQREHSASYPGGKIFLSQIDMRILISHTGYRTERGSHFSKCGTEYVRSDGSPLKRLFKLKLRSEPDTTSRSGSARRGKTHRLKGIKSSPDKPARARLKGWTTGANTITHRGATAKPTAAEAHGRRARVGSRFLARTPVCVAVSSKQLPRFFLGWKFLPEA